MSTARREMSDAKLPYAARVSFHTSIWYTSSYCLYCTYSYLAEPRLGHVKRGNVPSEVATSSAARSSRE